MRCSVSFLGDFAMAKTPDPKKELELHPDAWQRFELFPT
jgi:hypothetical protein